MQENGCFPQAAIDVPLILLLKKWTTFKYRLELWVRVKVGIQTIGYTFKSMLFHCTKLETRAKGQATKNSHGPVL